MNKKAESLSFNDLQDEYVRRRNLLSELHKTRAGVIQTLDTLDARIKAVEEGRELYVGQKSSKPVQTKTKTARHKNDASVSDFAIELITKNGPKTAIEVAKYAMDGGYQTISEFGVFVRSVNSRLRKDTRFVNIGAAKYGLTNATENGNGDGGGQQHDADGHGEDQSAVSLRGVGDSVLPQ